MSGPDVVTCIDQNGLLSTVAEGYLFAFASTLLMVLVFDVGQRVVCACLRLRGLPSFPPVKSPIFVVHLIHGTWAPNAPWASPRGCALVTALQTALGPNCQFTAPGWSGVNSFSARDAAARNLSSHLQVWFQRCPTARHILVGHSHGGTIALQTLQDTTLGSRVHSLVCLSTPFLSGRPQPGGTIALITLLLVAVLVLLARLWWDSSSVNVVLLSFGAPFAFLLAWFLAVLSTESFRVSSKQLGTPNVLGDRLLVVRRTIDEASIFISIPSVFATSLKFLNDLAKSIAAIISGAGRSIPRGWFQNLALAVGLTSLFAGGLVLLHAGSLTDNLFGARYCNQILGETAIGVGLLALGLVVGAHSSGSKHGGKVMLVIANAFFAPLYLPIMFLSTIAVGIDSLTTQATLIFGAEAAPVGSSLVVTLGAESFPERLSWTIDFGAVAASPWGLSHSSYDDPRVASAVVDWIETRNTSSPQTQEELLPRMT